MVRGMNFTIAKQAYGSNPWFAVPQGQETHPTNAAWLPSGGPTTLETNLGTVTTDGLVRFFARKRDVLAAIKRNAK